MSRRRYLSTAISTDSTVNKLRQKAGDFALILYTWMIPHADDKATIEADPEELLAIVCPLWRDKTSQDVAIALEAMAELGLIWWNEDEGWIAFPESFEEHQNYLKAGRRRAPEQLENQRESARIHENPRKSTKNSASFTFTSSLKSSSSSPPLPPTGKAPNGAPADDYRSRLGDDYWSALKEFKKLDPVLGNGWLGKALNKAPPGLSGDAVWRSLENALNRIGDDFQRDETEHFIKSRYGWASRILEEEFTDMKAVAEA